MGGDSQCARRPKISSNLWGKMEPDEAAVLIQRVRNMLVEDLLAFGVDEIELLDRLSMFDASVYSLVARSVN
jgi:hypothetical protein